MIRTKMKTPISYYGGKQNLAKIIVDLIPDHNLYCEPFMGGGAIFFSKEKSNVEVINDTNKSLMTFYRMVKNDFVSLETQIRISLHSRDLHRKADVIRLNPDMFTDLQIAWSVWVLSAQSFSSMLDGSWGYDVKRNTTSKKIHNKRESFTEDLAIRLQLTQIECADAIRIIKSRDSKESFFYCDPPYYNSDCGHYDGYTLDDFTNLLVTLSKIEGRFILSSYPSAVLLEYTAKNNWYNMSFQQQVSVGAMSGKRKNKLEVITANFELK